MNPFGWAKENQCVPKMRCTCGEVISWSLIPNPIEWLMISETDYDGLTEPIDSQQLYSRFTHLMRCEHCGRLYVFWNGFGQAPAEYVPAADAAAAGPPQPGDVDR